MSSNTYSLILTLPDQPWAHRFQQHFDSFFTNTIVQRFNPNDPDDKITLRWKKAGNIYLLTKTPYDERHIRFCTLKAIDSIVASFRDPEEFHFDAKKCVQMIKVIDSQRFGSVAQ